MENKPLDYIGTEIAVIGMACRLPGAHTPQRFWENMRDGVESIQQYTDETLQADGVPTQTLQHPSYIKAGAPLDKIEQFDAPFFGMGPKEAAVMDPQHRHFLEVAWEALEHSSYDPDRYPGSIGVFGGSGHNLYLPYNILTNQELLDGEGFFLLRHTGNDKDFLTTRVSYAFDLKGPSVNVQTACSTSLVAIHLATQALLNAECDLALAGGVTLEMPHRHGYFYKEGEILSPDGHCRPFDASSGGTVFGSGAGVVVLKRLDDALADGDTIHALILGSAVNNDGARKASYLAPSPEGQALVIDEALGVSDVSPETIDYIETHGTGTALGDPIEIQGLSQAYQRSTDKLGYCAIGSTKANIGHLDTAAGVAGFIKTVMALKHQQLPPMLNFERPNPHIDFDKTPFYVNKSLREWTKNGHPRRAGVSSLGVGGTNAHVVLQEAPFQAPSQPSKRLLHLFPISAASIKSLEGNIANLQAHIADDQTQDIADIAHTLQHGRKPFANRAVVVAQSHADLNQALSSRPANQVATQLTTGESPKLIFTFPGGGAQYAAMGRDLYVSEPVYRDALDACFAILKDQCGIDLKPILFPEFGEEAEANQALKRPSLSLPAVLSTEYALSRLWDSWGIRPEMMIGHSMGEYAAALLAGVFTLEDALSLVVLRGQLFETLPEGGMLSVNLSEEKLLAILNQPDYEGLVIGVINHPDLSVISGPVASLERLEAYLAATEIGSKRIKINVAAHSPMLDPILEPFKAKLQAFTLNQPAIPYISNVTGTWITPEEATDPQYWCDHLRSTVRFSEGLATLMEEKAAVFLEVGPGHALSSFVRQHPSKRYSLAAIPSMRHVKDVQTPDDQHFLLSFGRLWTAGVEIDWSLIYPDEKRRRVPLPTYAFDHQPYWIEPGNTLFHDNGPKGSQLVKRPEIDQWFYRRRWVHQPHHELAHLLERQHWLVFEDDSGLGEQLSNKLRADGHTVIEVTAGDRFKVSHAEHIMLRAGQRADYDQLLSTVRNSGQMPTHILHCWTFGPQDTDRSGGNARKKGFFSLLYLAQALGGLGLNETTHLSVITSGSYQIGREPLHQPENGLLAGPIELIEREIPNISTRLIDLQTPKAVRRLFGMALDDNASDIDARVDLAYAELTKPFEHQQIVLRESGRWLQALEPIPAELIRSRHSGVRLRKQGVYLITGGFGGMGRTIAKYLVDTYQAKLILVSRSLLPDMDQRQDWVETHNHGDQTSQKIRFLNYLEANGGEVITIQADVTNRDQMRFAVDLGLKRFGAINGIMHAAGIVDDELIQLKTAETAERVLAPKVKGTQVIYEMVKSLPLDFMLLFSSTSTAITPIGQVDYVSANAFLNRFARAKSQSGGWPVIALNWGVWQEVGMAVRVQSSDEAISGITSGHPLTGFQIEKEVDRIRYQVDLQSEQTWVLDQHRIRQGHALIPGTGYLEMARAALVENQIDRPVEISEVYFLEPLNVLDGERMRTEILLQKSGQAYQWVVKTLEGKREIEHARGWISDLHAPHGKAIDIETIRARCQAGQVRYGEDRPLEQEKYLDFGPRWQNLKEVWFGDHEALGRLALSEAYHDDLKRFGLHPALLDIATTIGLPLLKQSDRNGVYVPLHYKQLKLYAPLTPKLYSHVTLEANQIGGADVPAFDIVLADEAGRVVAEIDHFVMRKVPHQQIVAVQEKATVLSNSVESGESGYLADMLAAGILPHEGIAVLETVLRNSDETELLVSPVELERLRTLIDQSRDDPGQANGLQLNRPEMMIEYVEATNAQEHALVKIWESLLGVSPIGIHDNFFELGGHSLIAVRLFAKIKQRFAIDFSLATLFDAPTISGLIELIGPEDDRSDGSANGLAQTVKRDWSPLVEINRGEPSLTPFFCMHGAGGNVINFVDISRHVGKDIPFYGLQAVGVDGHQVPQTTIEKMATTYLAAIRERQPTGPYLFGGYSGGGVIAYEMARQLELAGETVQLIAFLDTFHPLSKPRRRSFRERMESLGQSGVSYLLGRVRERLADRMTERERELLLHELAVNQETIPVELREWQLTNNFLQALGRYEPQAYAGRVVQFTAEETWWMYEHAGPDRGWAELLPQLELIQVPGSHESMVIEPNVQILASYLRSLILSELG